MANRQEGAKGLQATKPGTLSAVGYARLLRELSGLLEAGKAEAEAVAGYVLVRTYWQVGVRVLAERMTDRAGYGAGVVNDLAGDLGLAPRTLQYALRFARLYPEAPRPGLSWAHYRELLGIADERARRWYEDAAISGEWSRRRLVGAIRDGEGERSAAGALPAGESSAGGATGAMTGASGAGRIVRPRDGNYVYRCEVERVIDGDTLMIHIDLGFDVIRAQRLRLVNVDAQEGDTQAGKAATRFVRKRMAEAETVVVKTARSSDARGRYLAHVFYSGKQQDADEVFRRGRYLNAELLAEGHGVVLMDG